MAKHRPCKRCIREGVLRERHRAAAVAFAYLPSPSTHFPRDYHGVALAKKILEAGDKIPEADHSPESNSWALKDIRRIPGWADQAKLGKVSVKGMAARIENRKPPVLVLSTRRGTEYRLQIPPKWAALLAAWPKRVVRVTIEVLEEHARPSKYGKSSR